MSEWLCEEDYKKVCERVGREVEVKTLRNTLGSPCILCGKVAVYLVDARYILSFIHEKEERNNKLKEKPLPKEYTPSCLREKRKTTVPPRPIRYGIGIEEGEGEVGMIHGPLESIEDLLEVVGEKGWIIIRFGRYSDETLYRWKRERWVMEDESTHDTRGDQ